MAQQKQGIPGGIRKDRPPTPKGGVPKVPVTANGVTRRGLPVQPKAPADPDRLMLRGVPLPATFADTPLPLPASAAFADELAEPALPYGLPPVGVPVLAVPGQGSFVPAPSAGDALPPVLPQAAAPRSPASGGGRVAGLPVPRYEVYDAPHPVAPALPAVPPRDFEGERRRMRDSAGLPLLIGGVASLFGAGPNTLQGTVQGVQGGLLAMQRQFDAQAAEEVAERQRAFQEAQAQYQADAARWTAGARTVDARNLAAGRQYDDALATARVLDEQDAAALKREDDLAETDATGRAKRAEERRSVFEVMSRLDRNGQQAYLRSLVESGDADRLGLRITRPLPNVYAIEGAEKGVGKAAPPRPAGYLPDTEKARRRRLEQEREGIVRSINSPRFRREDYPTLAARYKEVDRALGGPGVAPLLPEAMSPNERAVDADRDRSAAQRERALDQAERRLNSGGGGGADISKRVASLDGQIDTLMNRRAKLNTPGLEQQEQERTNPDRTANRAAAIDRLTERIKYLKAERKRLTGSEGPMQAAPMTRGNTRPQASVKSYQTEVRDAAKRYGVSENVLWKAMREGSGGDPDFADPKTARYGLFAMPNNLFWEVADELKAAGKINPNEGFWSGNPSDAAEAAAYVYKRKLDESGGDVKRATEAYNKLMREGGSLSSKPNGRILGVRERGR